MAWKNLRDNNGKAALYMLLGQAEWILRRTETVSFLNGGNTRRSISFDCMLPGDDAKWLRWIPDTHDSQTEPRYVGLPVTFLGKSDLINLDCATATAPCCTPSDDATTATFSMPG